MIKRLLPSIPQSRWFLIIALLIGFLSTNSGCQNIIRRGQSPDDEQAKTDKDDKTKYVSSACRVWGLNIAKVEGIGLAVDLDGTGSNPSESGQRDHLKKELMARGADNVTQLVSSQDTSMVLLRGYLPPAIRKGDRYDVEIRTMRNSETTSLEGGFVLKSGMRPIANLGRRLRQGSVTGYGEGNVYVDGLFETRDDQPNKLHGWIFGGGVATESRPIGLTLSSESTSVRTSTSIARAINDRFTTIDKTGRKGVANPKSDREIELEVPDSYRHNIGRYSQVVMSIAFDETATERVNRLEKLDREISQPSLAKQASIRLEAIGKDAIPALKRALRHHEIEVKFHAAQALAYLGEAESVEHLRTLAENESAFRWHSLTALASLDDKKAGEALASLLHVQSAETRYGAFRSLQARSPNDPLVQGKWLASSFNFHEIASETTDPMIHFTRSKRPEVTVFGENQTLGNSLLYVETGLTVKSIPNNKIQITRFNQEGTSRLVCSNRVGDLVKSLAKAGCGYGTQIKLFREAAQKDQLNSRLVVNAVPKIRRDREAAVSDLAFEKSEAETAEDLPELFRTADQSEAPTRRVKSDLVELAKEADLEEEKKGPWKKFQNWFSSKPQ